MDKNHKMISNLTNLKDEHKFHEDRNWNNFENSQEFDDILYFEYARLPRLVTRMFHDE